MDLKTASIVGLSALALLFAVLAFKSWRADRQKRHDTINRRMK